MEHSQVQAFHSSLKRAMDAAERAIGAQTRGIQFKHQLAYHQHQIDYASEALEEAKTQLAEIREELPDQEESKIPAGDAVKVRAHKRVLKKKPHARTLEEAGGDLSKLQTLEDAVNESTDEMLAGFKETNLGQKPPAS